jgi:hypothetical protein
MPVGLQPRPLRGATLGRTVEEVVRRSSRNVFLRQDFAKLGSYNDIGRAMRQMAKDGELLRIGYGLYAKAEVSPLTGRPVPLIGIKRLATEALLRLGEEVSPSTFEDSYNSGRSSQVPTGRTIMVKDPTRQRIGYKGHYATFQHRG